MNIFYLDPDPRVCATYHVDRHVIKMILETAQLLCTAHWETGGEAPYRSTHKNHPSAIWARQNTNNYKWLCQLGLELCKEYTHRYGKTHKTQQHLEWLTENIPNLPLGVMTPPTPAMPEAFITDDILESYQKYYKFGKKHLHNWKKREKPDFLERIIW